MLNRKNLYFRNRKERTMNTKLQLLTRRKIYAGFVGQKQLPALFKLTGGQTTTEHEARTNLTAKRCKQGPKTTATPQISL